MRYDVALVVALGGCGSVAQSRDAAVQDASGDSALDAAVRCNPDAAFGAAQPIAELNTSADEDFANLSADELTIYFSSTRVGSIGGYDLFVATRPDRSSLWGNVQPIGGVNTTGNERAPMMSEDQRTLYALTGVAPDYQLGVTTRTTASGLFNGFTDAPVINAVGSNDEPGTLLANAIYFSSNRIGDYQILRASRTGTVLGTPFVVAGDMLDLPSIEAQPIVTPDELTMYFESTRSSGLGADDIWMAKRTKLADGFSAPVNLTSLNSSGVEFPTWISSDNCVLYFTSRTTGNYEFYVATRGW